VGHSSNGQSSVRNNRLSGSFGPGGVYIIDDNLRAFAAKAQGDGTSNAMGCSCHHYYFIAKALLHQNVTSSLLFTNWPVEMRFWRYIVIFL